MRATSKTVQTTEIGMLLVLLTWPTADLGGRQTLGALPGRLGEYVREHVDLTPDGHRQLLQGEPVTKLLPGDTSKEVAIFGAVWINSPISAYAAAVNDIEQFEKGPNFLVTEKISEPVMFHLSTDLTIRPLAHRS
jgi:hypothetical protein